MSLRDVTRQGISLAAQLPGVQPVFRRRAVRSKLPFGLASRLPLSGMLNLQTPAGVPFVYVTEPRDGIGRLLFWGSSPGFEPETLSLFETLAKESSLIVDVGAHTGLFSLIALASNSKCEVIAFEPIGSLRHLISMAVSQNSWGSRFSLRSAVASDQAGEVEFHIPHSESSLALSASVGNSPYLGEHGETVLVESTTLDKELAGKKVDLLKIDVEGHELSVLNGARDVLARCGPDIVFECNPGGRAVEIQSLLDEYQYVLWHLSPSGPKLVSKLEPDLIGGCRNFLASTNPSRVG